MKLEGINWSETCERLLNEQINSELTAFYQYKKLYSYFADNDVAYMNVANYFLKASNEEKEHADKLIDYQIKRGGDVNYTNITAPNFEVSPNNTDSNILQAFKFALTLETDIYNKLLVLHESADPAFADFIEGEYLHEQVNANHELLSYISILKTINNDKHGLWHFDRELSNGE